MAERFAILGWGSLLWERRKPFDSLHGEWQPGGPLLKIEFSRVSVSRDDALTLVIDPVHGVPVPTSFCISTRASLEEAVEDLRIREGPTTPANIGFLHQNGKAQSRDAATLDTIRAWLSQQKLEGVTWTDLPANFAEKSKYKKPFSIDAAREHLEGLSESGKTKAREYMRDTPEGVKTPLRAAIEDFVAGKASTLSRRERLRRAALLCLNCERNIAFFRQAQSCMSRPLPEDRIYLHTAINNNFLDTAVLEWCKLFGNETTHRWSQLVRDKRKFHAGLLAALKCTKVKFHEYRRDVLRYRTDFVAHLLDEREMRTPVLDMMLESVMYYYAYLLVQEDDGGTYLPNLVGDIRKDHAQRVNEAQSFYKREFR